MTEFKCANCGRIVKSAEGSVFTMEQIVKWNKQCKACNEADMLEYYKRTACEKNQFNMSNLFDGDVSASVMGLIGVCQTSNDLSALFNL